MSTKALNTRRVIRMIPVTDGDIVDLPRTGIPGVQRRGYPGGSGGTYTIGTPPSDWSGAHLPSYDASHLIIGYQPAPLNPRARKPYEPTGWLIVLVDDSVTARPERLRRNSRTVS
jgi:hypothetical protein